MSEHDTWPWTEPSVRRIVAATTDTTRRFHLHLDECGQCRDHPFALCPIGATLLKAAALDPAE